ncbi:hypothetical protein [Bacillus cereus]|uniref:hypothetical protein n=1 Tax=Bacillus cereus TaxID=1396 RepID=UPI001E301FA5|nr:hypothetical protein [Bacillus cereus]MCD2338725.1 hypothetical protein [Bacillus cereus]
MFDFVKNTLILILLKNKNIFKPEMVEKLLSIQATKPNGKTALALWSLMIFQLWMEQFNVSISPEDTSGERGSGSMLTYIQKQRGVYHKLLL